MRRREPSVGFRTVSQLIDLARAPQVEARPREPRTPGSCRPVAEALPGLTPKQLGVLKALMAFSKREGRRPTSYELCREAKVSAPTMRERIKRLVAQGWLRRGYGRGSEVAAAGAGPRGDILPGSEGDALRRALAL
jgi:hypothetical protein